MGIEIGRRTIRLAWVKTIRGGTREWHYAEEKRLRPDQPDTLSTDLRKVLGVLRGIQWRAHLILASPQSHIRVVKLRVPDAKALAAALREQLPTLLPFDAEKAHVQFRITNQERHAGGQIEYTIQLAACEKIILDEQLEALWHAGWVSRRVCPSALALVEAAANMGLLTEESAVMLHIGEETTTIILTDHAQAFYARTVFLGKDHLTNTLSQQIAIGNETVKLSGIQAEELQKHLGFPHAHLTSSSAEERIPVATYTALLQPVLEQLIGEVKRTIAFGAQTGAAASPKRVILSGAGAQLPHSQLWANEQLALPVERLNPQQLSADSGSASAIVCGLAQMKRPLKLDLLPANFRKRRQLLQASQVAWQVLLGAALFLWLGTGFWALKNRGIAGELNTLGVRRSQLEVISELNNSLSTQHRVIQWLRNKRGIPLDWFKRFSDGFPDSVRLAQLSVQPGSAIKMDGEAEARGKTPEARVSELSLWLEKSGVCSDVRLSGGKRGQAAHGHTTFSISCRRR